MGKAGKILDQLPLPNCSLTTMTLLLLVGETSFFKNLRFLKESRFSVTNLPDLGNGGFIKTKFYIVCYIS